MPRSLLLLTLLGFSGAIGAATDEGDRWSRTIERISAGIVAIQVDATRAFDTEWNQSSQATGFIVDAERGLILTNRHVVTPGPVVAQAVFLNREEVELTPVYRDPVHDFGFFSFDPKALRFIEPVELPLVPQAAVIGREIRVIGNDAGEQLSILAGTLARLDRQAPDYGVGKYNDFNTFYYQAASSTSGGSSGSPVIDMQGRVVALNAGANTGAASSFFLPLDRVQRALELIRAGQPVVRGTLQTVFVHSPYDELGRLGLQSETEALVREAYPGQTGMLVVDQVVPGAPAEHLLEPGDILVKLHGELIAEFAKLAEILDAHVGESIEIELQRGGVTQRHVLPVEDLHAITPDEYVEFGDAVVHQLSFQVARHYHMAPIGIFVANPGYALGAAAVPRGAVIVEFNGHRTDTLDDFQRVLEGLADRERATVRFYTYDDPQTTTLRVIYNDRRWFPAQRCVRNDRTGFWPCEALPPPPEAEPLEPATVRLTKNGDPRIHVLAPSLVMVQFDMPYTVSGISERNYYGTGLIVDAERGYVVVDRNTVPVSLGDVKFTFAGSLEIPGRVEYIHPLHNLAVIAYDPRLIGSTPVRSARFAPRKVEPGERIWVVGMRPDQRVASQASEIAAVEPVGFPLSRTMRFRDSNLETISLVNPPGDYDGVLADKDGRVVSLWSSFAYQSGRELEQTNKGVPADIVLEMLDALREGRDLRSLEAEFALIPLASARKLGLSGDWAERLVQASPDRRQVLSIVRLVAGSPAERELEPGDLLLGVDGQVVTRFREVEQAVQQPRVTLTLWRDGAEQEVVLDTVALKGQDVERVVMWAGALLQPPHREMSAQRGIPPVGVYVAYFSYGSPANRYNLWAGRRIVAIDERPTPDLDAFVAAVSDKRDRDSVRVKTVNWNGAVEVITLKLDNRYWPPYELRSTERGWQSSPLPGSPGYGRLARSSGDADELSPDH